MKNQCSLSQTVSIMAHFDDRLHGKLTHDIDKILELEKFEILSTNYRKLKNKFGWKKHQQFYDFIKDNKLAVAITELAFTKFDIDKSFLNVLKPVCGEEFVEEYKKKPSAIIKFDDQLKISSHLIIVNDFIAKKL